MGNGINNIANKSDNAKKHDYYMKVGVKDMENNKDAMNESLQKLRDILHHGGYSLVVEKNGCVRCYKGRGISDLMHMLEHTPCGRNNTINNINHTPYDINNTIDGRNNTIDDTNKRTEHEQDRKGKQCATYNANDDNCEHSNAIYNDYQKNDGPLRGANIADKVVGKAAAAIMVAGGVNNVYTDLISSPALKFLRNNGVYAVAKQEVHAILNAKKSDLCPMERATLEATTVAEAIKAIRETMKRLRALK